MVIDLGEPRDEIDLAPRPVPARQRRAAGVAVLLAALLAACGGAAPVRAELAATTVRATAADEVTVDDDALYVMRPGQGVVRAGLRTITRYSLADAARPEWEAAFYTTGPVRGASLVDGMLLATANAPDIETIAIRPGTGGEAWRRTGSWHRTGPGRLLLRDFSARVQQRLLGVELASGAVRWSRLFPADDAVFVEGGQVIRSTSAGAVEVYDAGTGALTASARLPLDPEMTPQVAGGLLLMPGVDEDRPVLGAYGLNRLDRRWEAEFDLRVDYLTGECGDGLCAGDVNNSGLRFVEVATGRTRWSTPHFGYAHQAGRYLLAYGGSENARRIALLDPADGRVVADLGDWSFASTPDRDGRMLVIREKDARAVVARIDPAAMDVEVLGALDGVFQCQATPAAVVCRQAGGSIGVWHPRRKL